MDDVWDTIKDRWEWDDTFKEQILLAVIIGSIGLAFTLCQTLIKVRIENA